MRTMVLGVVVGLSSVIGASVANAQEHKHTKACEALLQEPTPYAPFENVQLPWIGYSKAKAKLYLAKRKVGDEPLERPAVFMLLSENDYRDCLAAYFERVVFASRFVLRHAKQFTAIRFRRAYFGGRPELLKLLGNTGKPRLVVLGVDRRVVATFDKKVGPNVVLRAIRKALQAQRSAQRSHRSMTQHVLVARKAIAKSDFKTAGERLARVLRPKASRGPAWVEAKQLLVKVEQAGVKALKAVSAKKKPLERYKVLLGLEETFRAVKTIRALVRKRIKSLEEGPETWTMIQEYNGTQRIKAAVALAKSGKRAEARAELKEIEREYLGLACALKARKLQARLAD